MNLSHLAKYLHRPLLGAFLLCFIITSSATKYQNDCGEMVHIISVRETSANPGPGMMRNVSNSIAEKILHPDPQAVDYPATWDNPPYSISEGQGVNETRRMLEEYTSTCPNSDIVLLGYSQGAQVVADVLCGTSESGFHPSSPLPWGIGQSVKAAILMGDPSHRQTAPYNFNHTGSGNLDELYPRMRNVPCSPYTGIIRSYCDKGDYICSFQNVTKLDAGVREDIESHSVPGHDKYVERYLLNAVEFVLSKLGYIHDHSI